MTTFTAGPRVAASLLVAALVSPTAGATSFPTSDYLTGNWNGLRDRWNDAGFAFNLNYTAQPMFNVAGGEVLGGTYADNIALDFFVDLERSLGVPSTNLLIKLSQRNGESVSSRFVAPSEGGNTFTVQELYGGQNFKLANVQLNTRLLDDRLDLAYGRLIANDDFLRSDLYCTFANNSFCGSPKPVFLQNPFTFTAYPLATWGARARYDTPSRVWTFQAAVYDGDPELRNGDAASKNHNEHGLSWGLGDNGVTLAGEIHYHVNRDSDQALPGVYKLGGFYLTGDYEDLSRTDGATVTGNGMLWLLADQMLYRVSPGSSRGLSAFGALVFSLTDEANQMSHYFNVGLVYEGLFEQRPTDRTGFGVSAGWYSDAYDDGRIAAGLPSTSYEAAIELNHRFALTRGIAIQPDIQYIIRPAGTGEIDNAFLIGARVSVDF
jgi:porin